MGTDPVHRDGLVVDLEHAHLVTTELGALGVSFTGPVDDHTLANDRLGLALLTELRELPLSVDEEPVPVTDLDALLVELRRRFAADRGGWVPLMGKNRPVDGVIRTGTSKPMGYADPRLVEAVEALDRPLTGQAGHGVRVGIVDTPLFMHPSFDPARVHADPVFVPPAGPDAPVSPNAGHGTFVASLVLAQAPGAELFVRGVLDVVTGRVDAWTTAVAIAELGDTVDVLNLSLACFTADGEPPLVIRRAIERLDPRVVVVAAAGNHGDQPGWQRGRTSRSPAWPAAMLDVTAVGAVTDEHKPAAFSPQAPWVDCTAVGVDVEGAYLRMPVTVHDPDELSFAKVDVPFSGRARWSGTSFAAATVTGAIAAAMSGGRGRGVGGNEGGLTARAALDALLATRGPDAVVHDVRRTG